jgi:hypothetical protein
MTCDVRMRNELRDIPLLLLPSSKYVCSRAERVPESAVGHGLLS